MHLRCCKSNFKTTTFQIKIFNDVLFIANIIMSSKMSYLLKTVRKSAIYDYFSEKSR